MRMIHTKFGYESPTEAKCDGELNKYFNERNKRRQLAKMTVEPHQYYTRIHISLVDQKHSKGSNHNGKRGRI